MKHLMVLVVTLITAGCGQRDPFVTKTANFLVTNDLKYDEVQVEIDDKSSTTLFKKFIFAGLAENFEVMVTIAKPPENNFARLSPTGPDSNSNDWTTSVSVRFRITRTGATTGWLTCTAGAKLKTRVYIKPLDATRVETKCDSIR